ncbi:MAG: [Spirochaetaceae bacterium]|nr:[citrate (pro-3S)-lyase] ligase [Spirochaetaceae bacterium]
MFREEKLNIQNPYYRNIVSTFLKEHELVLDTVDTCFCIFDDDKIVACGCKEKNILKCFAVHNAYRNDGLFDRLLSKLLSDCYVEGESLIFCFTKLKNEVFFSSQNFITLANGNESVLLYRGNKTITETLRFLTNNITKNKKGAIVMNANPFTLGHKYLIEKSCECVDELIVFVVEEDKSFFSFEERFYLVKEGVKDFSNVKVFPSTPFLISRATFPSYFLKETTTINREHALIDAKIFGAFFVPHFNISVRFLGDEPLDANTNTYNEILLTELKKFSCDVKIIERLKTYDSKIISASTVRKLFFEKKLNELKDFLPISTYNFLEKKLNEKKY